MLTILVGVSIFVIGQVLLKLLVEPIVSLKTSIGELSALFLREHACVTNASATEATQQALKNLTSRILSHKQAIPLYPICAIVFGLPSEKKLIDSCSSVNYIAHYAVKSASEEKSKFGVAVEIHKEMKNISQKMKILVEYIKL